MPSTSLTDYQVLQDGNTHLSVPVKEPTHERLLEFNWVFPDDLVFDDALARRPILSFKVRVFEAATFFVKLNDVVVVEPTELAPDNVKVWWEVINLNTAFPDGRSHATETISLQLQGGHMRVSDVVIWYQINR